MANTSVQKTRSGRGLWLLPVAAGAFLLAVLGLAFGLVQGVAVRSGIQAERNKGKKDD